MRIACRRLGLDVPENPPHHRQAVFAHHRLRGERVPEVVNAHVLKPRGLANLSPWPLQARQIHTFAAACHHEPIIDARVNTLVFHLKVRSAWIAAAPVLPPET